MHFQQLRQQANKPLLDIVAIPFHDWKKSQAEGFRTRDAHLLQEFSQHPSVNKLLIINRPISIAEILILRRPLRVNGGELIQKSRFSWLSQLDEKLFVLDIFVPQFFRPLIKRRKWQPYIFGRRDTSKEILKAIHHLDFDEYVLFLSSPLPVPICSLVEPSVLVLDAVDNLTKAAGFMNMQEEIKGYYEVIRKDAEVIFANSVETTEWLSEGRDPVIHIPNGVNPDFFKIEDASCPDDLRDLPKPIVGYAGKMQELFDVELLSEVADQLPQVTFICIGQILNSKWMKKLWNYPNVYYLGDKHYDDLPNYLDNFDICIIPYNVDRQHGGDPIKYYEYLAAGKPVVTTDIGGVSELAYLPQVNVISGVGDFIYAIKRIIKFLDGGNAYPRIELPEDVRWSSKADKMIRTILQD